MNEASSLSEISIYIYQDNTASQPIRHGSSFHNYRNSSLVQQARVFQNNLRCKINVMYSISYFSTPEVNLKLRKC